MTGLEKFVRIWEAHHYLTSAKESVEKYNQDMGKTLEPLLEQLKDDWYTEWNKTGKETRREVVELGYVPHVIYEEFRQSHEAIQKMTEISRKLVDIVESIGRSKTD